MRRKKISISKEVIEDKELTPRDLIVYFELLRQKRFVSLEKLSEKIRNIVSEKVVKDSLNKFSNNKFVYIKTVNINNKTYFYYKAIPCRKNCIKIDYKEYDKVKNKEINIDYFYSYLQQMIEEERRKAWVK